MQRRIRTVTGDIPVEELGWCQTHEHLFLQKGKPYEIDTALCMDDFDRSIEELNAYKAAGGGAIVDAQPVGSGRMAGAMAEASYATGVSIIACTGFHKQNFYYEDSFIFREKEETLAGLFTSEVTDGMLPSGRDEKKRLEARAGVIKVAVEKNGVRTNAAYEKLFAAAAAAAAKTGAPVLAHFDKDADALALIEYLGQYNIPANRLIACHLDRARYDIGYHREVAQSGAWMEYDTINRLKYHDNEKEFKLIQGMIEAGYAGRMLFSLDTTNKRLRAYGADMGLDYLLKEFTVYMQQRGLGGYMRQIMVNNPAQAVAIQKGTEEKRTAASAITHHVPLM